MSAICGRKDMKEERVGGRLFQLNSLAIILKAE